MSGLLVCALEAPPACLVGAYGAGPALDIVRIMCAGRPHYICHLADKPGDAGEILLRTRGGRLQPRVRPGW